jgi:hypothetical protein
VAHGQVAGDTKDFMSGNFNEYVIDPDDVLSIQTFDLRAISVDTDSAG